MKRILSIILSLLLLLSVIQPSMFIAFADDEESTGYVYLAADGSTKDIPATATAIKATNSLLSAGWYTVSGEFTIYNMLGVSGDVHIVLMDDANLTVTDGIVLHDEYSNITIYAQSTGSSMGKLTVTDVKKSAGIGPAHLCKGGNITICGGNINVKACSDGAGIGSGRDGGVKDITIYDGIINIAGGERAAGIGSGNGGSFDTITINGGIINANGAESGAGVGGGYHSTLGSIIINGGMIDASGGDYGAGIGGGLSCIGGTIEINGGTIRAIAGTGATPIGKGKSPERNFTKIAIRLLLPQKQIYDAYYVNIEPTEKLDANCINAGHPEYFKDSITNTYHTAFPFTEDNRIGDEIALNEWKSNGSGYIAPLGHIDEDENNICDRCSLEISSDLYNYLDYDDTEKKLVQKQISLESVTLITQSATDLTLASGWYLVTGEVTIENRITLGDEVHLILNDGAVLNAKQGIAVGRDLFAIYARSAGDNMGILTATGMKSCAGIGSNKEGSCGNIVINGGKVTAFGGELAAAIGSAYTYNSEYASASSSCGKIEINGGTVTAIGGNNGAGIGSGYTSISYSYSSFRSNCGKIEITGGVIAASSGDYAAGIGSGQQSRCDGGITITGGVITASGGDYAAGIGSGSGGSCDGDISITGGIITASGGYDGAGIGTGYRAGCDGGISITDGVITASGGIKAAGIGSGSESSCDGGITIDGGYIKATNGELGEAIGKGFQSSCCNVTYVSCTKVDKDGSRYVNYAPEEKAPTCTEDGYSRYFIDYLGTNIKYYTAFPFSTDNLIGDDGDLNEWKANGGDGYVASRHFDENDDSICDICKEQFCTIHPAQAATCTTFGYKKFYEDNFGSGNFYLSYPFTDDVLIGDSDALGLWRTVAGGGGYIAPLGHYDTNGDTICERCKEQYYNVIAAAEPDCEHNGHKVYYLNLDNGKYYSAFPLSEDAVIGRSDELDEWLSFSGEGYTGPALGHKDLDGNLMCDNCGGHIYYDYDDATAGMVLKAIQPEDVQVINTSQSELYLDDGWYLVQGNVVITNSIHINGSVHLILGNRCQLTVNKGILLPQQGLTIYAQALKGDNVGRLTTKGDDTGIANAGIGAAAGGHLSVNGGNIYAEGKNGGAGIGGSRGGNCVSVIIRGGTVEAVGSCSAAGIGGGVGGNLEYLRIDGGTVTAKGGENAAGIGGGYKYIIDDLQYIGSGGNSNLVVINGGRVTARGGANAAGIGAGYYGKGGIVQIKGGTTIVYGGSDATAFAEKAGGEGSQAVVYGENVLAYEIYDKLTNYGAIKEMLRTPSLIIAEDGTVPIGTFTKMYFSNTMSDDFDDPITPVHPVDPIGPGSGGTGSEVKEDLILNYCVDVKDSDYYHDAVLWAYKNGVCTGTDANHFSPNGTTTRGQMITFLWRMAGSPVFEDDDIKFTDIKKSDFFYDAVVWGWNIGIVNGKSATAFAPNDKVTRGESVTFIYRYAKVAGGDLPNPFTDVKQGEFYYYPVLWAANNEITSGVNATTFAPNADCTRAQVMTFLYRLMSK